MHFTSCGPYTWWHVLGPIQEGYNMTEAQKQLMEGGGQFACLHNHWEQRAHLSPCE